MRNLKHYSYIQKIQILPEDLLRISVNFNLRVGREKQAKDLFQPEVSPYTREYTEKAKYI